MFFFACGAERSVHQDPQCSDDDGGGDGDEHQSVGASSFVLVIPLHPHDFFRVHLAFFGCFLEFLQTRVDHVAPEHG